MPKIRHIAIVSSNREKLAEFYKQAFGMKQVQGEGGAIYLSDGSINLALNPHYAGREPGLYHFGFEVENGEKIVERLKKVNPNKLPKPRPNGRPYAETRGSDPDGTYFDISEHGFSNVVPLGEPKDKAN